MNAKRFRTRIERLERRINGHECKACTRTAFEQVAARGDPNLVSALPGLWKSPSAHPHEGN